MTTHSIRILLAVALGGGIVAAQSPTETPALASGRDFKAELTVDGLLPNDAGYKVMAALAEQAIAQALAPR
jgi:lysophospholipase L1-like esterase